MACYLQNFRAGFERYSVAVKSVLREGVLRPYVPGKIMEGKTMAIAQVNGPNVETQRREVISEVEHETWAHWPVRWTAVWVGTLAAVTAVLLFGLIGIALGAQVLNPDQR